MCGICAQLRITHDQYGKRVLSLQDLDCMSVYKAVDRLVHRGPDCAGSLKFPGCCLGHTRLIINGLDSGAQPIVNKHCDAYVSVNGEIYNHHELEGRLAAPFMSLTGSDCDVLTYLFSPFDSRFEDVPQKLSSIRGMFAFVWFSPLTRQFLVARDPFGIIPLYYGVKTVDGSDIDYFFASEVKAIPDGYTVREFPPGSYMTLETGQPRAYFGPRITPTWLSPNSYEECMNTVVDGKPLVSRETYLHTARTCAVVALRQKLYASIETHLMAEVPFGVLLSGGLDSTIVACTVADIFKKQGRAPSELHTFSIGVRDEEGNECSPDLVVAREVAEQIGSTHHSFTFTVEEALSAHPEVVKSIETYDTTTIRASTPMWLMAKKIKELPLHNGGDVKMVLSGEGADEIFAGYLYFKKAPNAQELQAECSRKVLALHQFDCLRANKSMMAHSIEVRVPFLDTPFVGWAMRWVDPELKMCGGDVIEKSILRDAFNDLIPASVYVRQKDQFSDAVGYSWIEGLKKRAESYVGVVENPEEMWAEVYPNNTPRSAEEWMNRNVFHSHFPPQYYDLVPWGKSIACSTEAVMKWDESFSSNADPSGLSLRHHTASAATE